MQIIFRAIIKNLLKLKKDFQFFGSLGLLLVCLDQLSKWLVEWFLVTINKSMLYIFHPWLNLNLVTNTGAAFGLFTNLSFFLTLLSTTVVVILPFYLKKELKNKIDTSSCFYGITFLWGGTAGNLIDRLSLGYVVDFIQIPYWPIFNLADTFIVFGVFFLIMNASRRENYE